MIQYLLALSDNIYDFLIGSLLTLLLTQAALCLGLIIIIFNILANYLKLKYIMPILNGFFYLIRGTPLLLQFFLLYYGIGQITSGSLLDAIIEIPFVAATLVLAINTSAYTSQVVLGALNNIDNGQTEAAKALNLNATQIFTRILLPQAIKQIKPSYENEAIIILKSTALASTITLTELTWASKNFVATTFMAISGYATAAVFYLLLAYIQIRLCRYFFAIMRF